jgi:long-chain acyl-CoA synthetase
LSHLGDHARATPDKAAYIMAETGEVVTYRELDERSAAGANVLRGHGLTPGSHCAILIENHLRFFEVVWAAHRAGLIFTAISTHLLASEIAYILENCDAGLLIISGKLERHASDALIEAKLDIPVYSVDPSDLFAGWDEAVRAASTTPSVVECAGMHMLYSSGTTGRPKGVLDL